MEGAAEIRRRSAAEYEFRMTAGARLKAAWRKQKEGLRDIRPALTLTAPEEHHRRNEVVPGQVLIKPGDIRPIAGTKDKTLRALAIHIVQNQLAGPYAGIDPEEVNAVGKPGEMIPVRVVFTLGKEVIPAVHNKARAYPLQQAYEAQRAEGNLNKQLYVRMRLPSDVTEVGPVPELVMEVLEAEWTSRAAKKTASRMNEASPPEDTRPNPDTGSPAKKHKPTKNTVRGVPKSKERLTVWCRLKAWTWTRLRTSTRLTPTHQRQRRRRMKNCLSHVKPYKKRRETHLLFRNTRKLLRRLPARYKHVYTRLIVTHKRRYTRLKRIQRNIIRRHSMSITEIGSERVKGEREHKHNRDANTLTEREGRDRHPGDTGEHLFAKDIGEHLFAKTESWSNREVESKRRWGHKGVRVGEASHPGPMTEDIHESFEERTSNRFNSEVLEKMQGLTSSHENWMLDNLDKRGASTGMRVATNNFERKLYASQANIEEAIEKMIKLEIDVLVATEPGQASIYNEEMIKTVARMFGFDVKIIKRSRDGTQGGIAVIINERWAKIPSVVTEYNPAEENLKDGS